jgi:hypothetical protein
MSVSIIDVDYRGYVSLPKNAEAKLRTEYFFAGTRGPSFEKDFRGVFEDNYALKSQIGVNSIIWSPCGEDVNLRVNTAMSVRTNQEMEQAMATVDSADFHAGLIYHLQWKECN